MSSKINLERKLASSAMSREVAEAISCTKVLDESHRLQIEDLILEQIQCQNKNQSRELFFRYLDKYLDSNHHLKYLVGNFSQEGELKSIMGTHLWPSLPYATFNYMFVKRSLSLFNSSKSGLVYCLHKSLDIGESNGIKAYYSVQKLRDVRHKFRTWRAFDTPLTFRYYSLLEGVIKANTSSNYTIFNELLDDRTWPYDMGIWCTRIKPEFERVVNW